ncbi:MAG: family 16 glycosylhydrolase [Trueperaceae bacterium]|nr:MAG: family 16 glycosylhydrolase [Trueperaceae bacterium]
MIHTILKTLLAALALAGPASALADVSVEDFEGAFPISQDVFGNGVGFVTWQDGGGELVLGTQTVGAGEDLAPPERSEQNTVMVIEHTINQWGGFTHAFTNRAADTWVSQDWSAHSGMKFWFKGAGSGGKIQVDLFDNRNPALTGDSAERYFFRFDDDSTAWRLVEIPFSSFRRRTDFQPGGAPNDGLTLTEVWGYALGFPPGAGVSYLDDVILVGEAGASADRLQVAFASPAVDLPEGGTTTATIVLNRPAEEPVSVRWLLRGDSARDYRDFVAANELVVFRPGETEREIELVALQDGKYEGDEQAVLILDSPLGVDIGFQRRATVFLRDDDIPDPDLVDDFGDVLGSWQGDPSLRAVSRELSAASAAALPDQDPFETVLEVAAPVGGRLARPFLQAQDWTGADALSFWFHGRGDGGLITMELLDNRAPDAGWTLAWADEFDGPAGAGPDPAFWTPEIGDGTANGIPGWGNAERETYTGDPENVAADGAGNLVITVRELSADSGAACYYGPCEYTSARLITTGKVEIAYGRVEARLQLPEGQGIWPALWMLGNDIGSVGWPASGEIDIMENIGREPSLIHGTIHGPGYSGGEGIGASYALTAGERFADGFHTFAIEWEPEEIRWYADGQHYNSLTPADLPSGRPWVFDHPFFLILNVAVGGYWSGYPDATSTFPQRLKVDYVRVYQEPDSAERWRSTFRDEVGGWTRVRLPFSGFTRAADQPPGAPDDGLGLGEVWGVALELPPGESPLRFDQLRRVGMGD